MCDDRTPSDQIRIIRATQGASDTAMLIQAVARALISFCTVLIGGYLLATGAQIPEGAQNIGLLILGAYFGTEALFKFLSRSSNGK